MQAADPPPAELPLSNEQRFELIKVEMGLLQSRMDKYDDLIFKNRNLLIVLISAAYGYGISQKFNVLFAGGSILSIAAWVLEIIWRWEYWYQYVERYRILRAGLNEGGLQKLALYDLSNHLGEKKSPISRFTACAMNVEPILFYLFWSALGGGLFLYLR